MGTETEPRGSASRRLTWLVVGAGDIAQKRVAPAIVGSERNHLMGICSRTSERAKAFAEKFGCTAVYTDLSEALANCAAEAVYLATPVCLHSRQAARVLASGRHVLVEKPLGISAADALLAVDAAQNANRQAACAYYRRLSPRYVHAKQMLAAGDFGRVLYVRMSYSAWFAPVSGEAKYWRVVRDQSGGGPLMDIGSHMLDLLIGLFGEARVVAARTVNRVHTYEVEDSAAVLLELEGGTPAFITCNWCSKNWAHEFEIVGTQARLKWDPFDTGPVLKTANGQAEHLDLPAPANVHAPLLEDFARAVQLGRPPAVPLAEALKTTALLDAIYAWQ